MRHVLFAAIAALPLFSGAAFAGNEQPYTGDTLPVASAPAMTETNTASEFQRGPVVSLSVSRVATDETGIERATRFDGMLASTGGASYAQR